MRESHEDGDPNDFLVMPGTNRGPSKSNVLTRANQIRAALHSVDNEQGYIQNNQQGDFQRLQVQYHELQVAYKNIQTFLHDEQQQHDRDIDLLQRHQNENTALREQLQQLKVDGPQDQSSNSKYDKALKEISNLMAFNKQLKAQVDYFKGQVEHYKLNYMQKQQFQRIYSQLMNQKNQIMMQAQRQEAKRKQIEETSNLYHNKIQQMMNFDNQHQRYQNQIGKLMTVIQNYQVETQKLRKKAEKNEIAEQQIFNRQSNDQNRGAEVQQLRAKQAGFIRDINHLKQKIESLQLEIHQKQLTHQRESENLKQGLQAEFARNTRSLQEQINLLKQDNIRLTQNKAQLEAYIENTVEEMRRKSSGDNNNEAVDEMKKYITTLKGQTNKLREILTAKDQLLADKAGLNKEVVGLNRQISTLTHENAQLKLRLESIQSKEIALTQQIHILQTRIEQERTESLRAKQSIVDSRLFAQPTTNNHLQIQQEFQRLAAENEALRQKLMKALEFSSLEKIATDSRPGVMKPERPISLNIRIRELRVLLQLILSGSNNSSVTMETAQLADLKTFTVQFEERLKLLSNQNEHLKKKVQDYRKKYHEMQKQSAQVEHQNLALTTKAEGYEKLVQKLENQLEKNIKKAQQTAGQMTIFSLNRGQQQTELRMQISDLNEKLQIQSKYLTQQLQTRQLEYEARLVSMQKKLDGCYQQIESVGLYTAKIHELSDKLVRLEMQNNEYRVQIVQLQRFNNRDLSETSVVTSTQQTGLLRQVYDKLSERQSQLLKLEYSLKEKNTELQQHIDIENQLKQQLYQHHLEIQRLKQTVKVAQQGEDRVAQQAKRLDQQQNRKYADVTKQNQLLHHQVLKLQRFEEMLAVEKQQHHQVKVQFVQAQEKVNQLELEINRLKGVEQSLRQLNMKHGELQNTSDYAKTVWQSEKNRLERLIKEKQNELQEQARLIAKIREEAFNEIRALRNNIGEYQAESESIRRSSEVSRYKTSEIQDQNGRLRSQISLLVQQIERYRQTESKLYETEKRVLQTNIAMESLKHKYDFTVKEHQRLQQRTQQLQDTISKAQLELNDRQRTIRSQKNELLDMALKVEDQTFKNGSFKSEIERLQKVINDMVQQSLDNSRKVTQHNTSYQNSVNSTGIIIPSTYQQYINNNVFSSYTSTTAVIENDRT